MRIGIDIGGTHTDGVLINGTRLVAAAKTATNPDNLLESISRVLQTILAGQDPADIHTLNLSTTLSTNAIVTGNIEQVGMLVTGGPGIPPQTYRIGDHFHLIDGSLDHLGSETAPLDETELETAIESCCAQGVRCFGVAAKFSPRNPAHEDRMLALLGDRADFVSCGHLISGQFNFGRRIHTVYYNSAVWRIFNTFAAALTASLRGFALKAEVNILKADGGTMPLARALATPVQSILSGPAASVMGILATTEADSDLLMLDIGGTTSDIALFAQGAPLLEREGIAIKGRPTLVRAIHVESIGVGGDSQIRVENNEVLAGPQRLGPCMAAGGEKPSLMDALNYLKLAAFGETGRSAAGIERLAAEHQINPRQLAQEAVEAAVNAIADSIRALIDLVNSRPVYTIHEILEERVISPKKLVIIGGPAAVFNKLLAARLNMEVSVPALHGVANAIGAALTRTTSRLVLSADTARGRLAVPVLGIFRPIPRGYTLKEATAEAAKLLKEQLEQAGVTIAGTEIQITQADAFNMVEGSYTAGKNIRVVAQVQPALVGRLEDSSAVPLNAGGH